MSKQKYQLSPNLRILSDPESGVAMAYHTLYGNPKIINFEGLRFLDLFKQPVTAKEVSEICDEDPGDIIRKFAEIFFLVEHGFDEKDFLRKQKSHHLSKVSSKQTINRMGLAISDSCNFGCTHCIHFQSSSNNGVMLPIYQKSVQQLNMNWETAKKCVDHYVSLMKKQKHTHCKIHFGNAEPLINWSVIAKILHYCDGINDLIFEFAINTNLVLMTREIAEVFKKYRVCIATSLDGTSQANNAIRITKRGRGTFNHILEKFDLLNEIGYPLDGFGITVTNRNFEFIDVDIIDLATQRGMTSIAFDYDLVSLTDIPGHDESE